MLTTSVATVNHTCGQANSGSITVTAAGVGALQFSKDRGTNWITATSPHIFSGLSASTYNIQVQDSYGYIVSYPTVIGPAAIVSAVPYNVS